MEHGIDFKYWLQGYFELTEDDNPLTIKQVKIISEHIELAKKSDPNDQFVNYVDGMLETFNMIDWLQDDHPEEDILEMRLWVSKRLCYIMQKQFGKVTKTTGRYRGNLDITSLINDVVVDKPFFDKDVWSDLNTLPNLHPGGRKFC